MAAAGSCEAFDLVGDIYDAALDESLWPRLLGRVADAMKGQFAVIIRQSSPASALMSARGDPEMNRRYVEHFRDKDLVTRAAAASPLGTVTTDRMLVAKAELHRSQFYNEFMRPMDSETWVGVALAPRGAVRLTISRTPRQGEWEPRDIGLLRQLAPHLMRAIAISRRLADAEQTRPAGAMQSFDRQPLARHAGPSVNAGTIEAGLAGESPPTHSPRSISLAPRESDSLRRVATGASSKKIARELGLSPHTVDQYIASAMRKLDAASRAEAVAKAFSLGLVA